ncbi:signal peptidase I [Nostoc sp. HG1]|nr:signal peptidase I [Nostoc sp. HG1]
MQLDNSHQVIFGNAIADGVNQHGWFIGHFIDENSARCTSEVEVKWGVHTAGDQRSQWSINHTATTLSILVHGRFRLYFPDHEILLAHEGDYALWLPEVAHNWVAEADSAVITVRLPSTSGDTIE